MGETWVDLLRLLEDLRDAYPGPVEETIITEIVANSLDSVAKQAAPPRSAVPGSPSRKRPARYGLRIRFESRPDDPTLGRLVETTVWVNDAHPAYRRAAASRSEAYHLALADVAVEPVEAQAFVRDFLVRWGASVRNGGSP